jgi:hypothetical protein
VLPDAFSANKNGLLQFENSSVLPSEVINCVRDFACALQDNADLLQRVLNIATREGPNYFLLNTKPGTRFMGAIEGRYYSQFKQLRSEADKVRDLFREALKQR